MNDRDYLDARFDRAQAQYERQEPKPMYDFGKWLDDEGDKADQDRDLDLD